MCSSILEEIKNIWLNKKIYLCILLEITVNAKCSDFNTCIAFVPSMPLYKVMRRESERSEHHWHDPFHKQHIPHRSVICLAEKVGNFIRVTLARIFQDLSAIFIQD